jgi:threonylcarbamoyladenosine tRNA methylthiotransferase MtaB
MGRHWYTADRYAEAVERLVDGHAAFGLGADVIAGFPGETDADHAATMALVERLPFTALHVFPYSARPGTAATRLGPLGDPARVARRAAELRAVGARKHDAHATRRAGTTADVVVVGDAAGRSGLTEDYLTVLLADVSVPRGARLPARLERDGSRLVAYRVPAPDAARPADASGS